MLFEFYVANYLFEIMGKVLVRNRLIISQTDCKIEPVAVPEENIRPGADGKVTLVPSAAAAHGKLHQSQKVTGRISVSHMEAGQSS